MDIGHGVSKSYEPRTYRELLRARDLAFFNCTVKETDLQIGVALSSLRPELLGCESTGLGSAHTGLQGLQGLEGMRAEAIAAVHESRGEIERYIPTHHEFLTSLVPVTPKPWAPPVVQLMCTASARAGVGPMAAVAGAIADFVGARLRLYSSEVIVENGGDIFIASSGPRKVGIYAGSSPLSQKVAIEVSPGPRGCGVCTSSGTVGHSKSFGRADAAVIIARDAALADAVATAVGNAVQSEKDVERAARSVSRVRGVTGAVVIAGAAMGAWGDVKLVQF
ncbi:MAG: UPF0280 family protein [Clostridia bacterium]|nr:UPF0280 family protein [Clostridia bacterium]